MEQTGDRVLKTLFFLIWIVALTHIAAEFHFWYWKFLWLDIPMHFVGGVWLGLAGLWAWNHSAHVARFRERIRLSPNTVALASGILIGTVWELYEFIVWKYSGKGFPYEYGRDVVLDLIMDTVGAIVGIVVYRVLARRSQTQHILK